MSKRFRLRRCRRTCELGLWEILDTGRHRPDGQPAVCYPGAPYGEARKLCDQFNRGEGLLDIPTPESAST
jgi:hypothetical protein